METNIPHTHGPQHNDPGHNISNNVKYNPAESANVSSAMPSECSLTTLKLPVNNSIGSMVPNSTY
jgi:hypothetical protein